MKTKLKAFTIVEVTVAMLLAAISIAITYTAYSLVSKAYFKFDEKNQKMAEFIFIDKQLKKDIETAKQIINSGDGLQIKTINGNITYQFKPDYILRNQYSLKNDTFFLSTANVYISFENQASNIDSLVDELKLDASLFKTISPLHYKKTYSAEELILGSGLSGGGQRAF